MVPHGPNVRVRFFQNKPYRAEYAELTMDMSPTNSVYENIFNSYDGIIIMTRFEPRLPQHIHGGKHMGARGPPPRCEEWSDVTFQQWVAMHVIDKTNSPRPEASLDPLFPPIANASNTYLFDKCVVAGREPSKFRMGLQSYCKFGGYERLQTLKFLNYIISYGECINEDTMAIIIRCLDSRDIFEMHHGRAPVFGEHETFEMGSWQFNALISTNIGHQVAAFLGRHKGALALGHKLIKSISVFAVDTRKVVKIQPPFGIRPALIKLPAIIWEMVDFHQEHIEAAKKVESEYPEDNLPFTPGARLANAFISEKAQVVLSRDNMTEAAQTPGNRVLK